MGLPMSKVQFTNVVFFCIFSRSQTLNLVEIRLVYFRRIQRELWFCVALRFVARLVRLSYPTGRQRERESDLQTTYKYNKIHCKAYIVWRALVRCAGIWGKIFLRQLMLDTKRHISTQRTSILDGVCLYLHIAHQKYNQIKINKTHLKTLLLYSSRSEFLIAALSN